MHERIALVREKEGLNQEDFAKRIGMTKSAISGYETGRRKPTEQAILSICREFNVSEMWLKYEEGEMYRPSPNGAIGALISEYNCTNFETEFLKAYFGLDAGERMEFMKYILKVFGPALKNTVGAGVNPFAQSKPDPVADIDVDKEVASYREELLLQKEAEAGSLASDGRNASVG